MRTNTSALRVALLTALGLASCGGQSVSRVSASSGGDGNASGGTGTQGGSGGVEANPFPCRAPIAGNDDPTGNTETCAGGLRHRQSDAACISRLPRPEPLAGASPLAECTRDSDCTALPNGYCAYGIQGGVGCQYGCLTDSDCAPGHLCDCGDFVGTCVLADCHTDADCNPGLLCTVYDTSLGCNAYLWVCQSPRDQCGGNDDCRDDKEQNNYCSAGMTVGARTCQPSSCIVGRPLVVDGAERIAAAVRREDWRAGACGPVLLEPDARRQAAEAWTRAGLLEHASIAAFARFVLELSAFAAPPELFDRAVRAQRDELGHARDAFELASRFVGHGVGPGPLALDGCLSAPSLERSVEAAVLEGCAGETLAALEAEEALATCDDDAVGVALARVRREEAEHAELAFRFVAWALEKDARLAGVVEGALERAVAEERRVRASTPLRSPHEASLRRVGILPEDARAELRARGLDEVVVPCVQALLAVTRAGAARRKARSAA